MLRAGAGETHGLNLVDKLVRHRDMPALGVRARRCCRSGDQHRVPGFAKKVPWRWGRYVATSPSKMRDAGRARRRAPEHYPAPFALIDLFEKHGNDWQAMIRR